MIHDPQVKVQTYGNQCKPQCHHKDYSPDRQQTRQTRPLSNDDAPTSPTHLKPRAGNFFKVFEK